MLSLHTEIGTVKSNIDFFNYLVYRVKIFTAVCKNHKFIATEPEYLCKPAEGI
jgi:hypothetical protein